MIDLLSREASRPGRGDASAPPGRPLLSAAVAGVMAAVAGLVVLVTIALAGWFFAGARHGDTRAAVRVGADAWLMAHGGSLQVEGVAVTVLPLGLTLMCAWLTARCGRWAGRTACVGRHGRTVLVAAATLAGCYAAVAVLAAWLSAHPVASVDLGRAAVGAAALALIVGGWALGVGAGWLPARLAALPRWANSTITGAWATCLLLVAGGALVLAAALLADFGAAASSLSRLHADGAGGLLFTLVATAFAPNAMLLTVAYTLGPGFMVGTGTLVSPTVVVLGPVPSFPLLAALPADGATPGWTTALLALPFLAAGIAAAGATRRWRVTRLDLGALSGLTGGGLAALGITMLVALAGGAVGPGRMADVGAPLGEVLLAAVAALGVGGLLGGLQGAVLGRRRVDHSRSRPADG